MNDCIYNVGSHDWLTVRRGLLELEDGLQGRGELGHDAVVLLDISGTHRLLLTHNR